MIRVLFFDDDYFIADCIIKNLRKYYGWEGDYEVSYVDHVSHLLREIMNENVKYDLFVLDMVAPIDQELFSQEEINEICYRQNTGLVIAKKIRKQEKYKNVPILFFSAGINYSGLDNTYYLEKPASTKELSELMNEILRIN